MATKTVSQLKQETFDHFSNMTPKQRLAIACWNNPYGNVKPTDKYGNLFGFSSRIWIDRSGKIFKNKPNK